MNIIISDTSIIIDLVKFGLIDYLFKIGYEIVVPDFIFSEFKKLGNIEPDYLIDKGMKVESFNEKEFGEILQIRDRKIALSIPDASAIFLAKKKKGILVTSDRAMYNTAGSDKVDVYRLLWLIEEFFIKHRNDKEIFFNALSKMKTDATCFVPDNLIDKIISKLEKSYL